MVSTVFCAGLCFLSAFGRAESLFLSKVAFASPLASCSPRHHVIIGVEGHHLKQVYLVIQTLARRTRVLMPATVFSLTLIDSALERAALERGRG